MNDFSGGGRRWALYENLYIEVNLRQCRFGDFIRVGRHLKVDTVTSAFSVTNSCESEHMIDGRKMRQRMLFAALVSVSLSTQILGQEVNLPRESNRHESIQTVGDARITVIYHRPNLKGREGRIFGCQARSVLQQGNNTNGCLVPNGQVWRAGANENTLIEFSSDVEIEGRPLKAGKYSFFVIPDEREWTLIFNKVNNEWGAFTYKPEQDALRVKVTATRHQDSQETLSYDFETVLGTTARVSLRWERISVSFLVAVGDVTGRVVSQIREAIRVRKADDLRPLNLGAAFVFNAKHRQSYDEALGWLEESIRVKETFSTLSLKARLLAESGRMAEAIVTGEKAIGVANAANVPATSASVTTLREEMNKWKSP